MQRGGSLAMQWLMDMGVQRMKTVVFKVSGMTCDGCAAAVTRAVKRAAPDADVSVDLAGGKVAVQARVPEAAIVRALRAAGYGVTA